MIHFLPSDPLDQPDDAWTYRTWNDLDGYPHMGKMATYSGGGFVASLGHTYEQADAVVQELMLHRWVDEYTRVVFIEFLTYNPNINLFGIGMSAVEFTETGGKRPGMPLCRFSMELRFSKINKKLGIKKLFFTKVNILGHFTNFW